MSILNRVIELIRKNKIRVILTFGLVIGLLFVFLVPPWMHYDEPGHFEYAWLIANKPGLPVRGEYDQAMRREVAASIVEYDIEGYTNMSTDPLQVDQSIDIFLTQVESHPPTYYLLASLPLRLFRHSEITFQLYLVRLVSLGLFLCMVWVAYRICLELFGEHSPITWMAPLFLVTLPSFVDIMTAANNDAAANLAFSLFLWASLLVIKKGPADLRLAALVGSVVLCLFTKSTAILAIPLSLFVLLLALFRGKKWAKWAWMGTLVVLLLMGMLLISWDKHAPAFYYGRDIHSNPLTVTTDSAPLGKAVITQEGDGRQFYHLLSAEDRENLVGQQITLGAWIWADFPTSIRYGGIQEGEVWIPPLSVNSVASRPRIELPWVSKRQITEPKTIAFTAESITLTTTPQFYAFSLEMPEVGGNMSWVYFPTGGDAANKVYWDGIVLAVGDFDSDTPPKFDDDQGLGGVWNGVRFTNLIRNASGEDLWPVFAGWVKNLVNIPNRIVPSASLIMSPLDFKATSVYYQISIERIFRTFWGVFGWANVALHGQKPYRIFFILTFIYSLGIMTALVRGAFKRQHGAFFFLELAAVAQIVIVLYRGVGSWFSEVYIPVGRYIYPVIIPLSIFISVGVDHLIGFTHKTTHTLKYILYGAYAAIQLGIMTWAIISIINFYRL
jgi:hypothetical protein